ncbi:hypothetical protein FRB96_009468 [Tulasnella sp. 330]|nr:hypothetical protein FRB96_009468 [Tulasnella sp. 330]KAG8874637.1 hypothetical protein FRB97_005756 [Tulasnella sp. 331]KAG8879550.1 hypothetical protein FRB98_005664 [Tulasnella sp. 332]
MATVNDLDPPNLAATKTTSPAARNAPRGRGRGGEAGRRGRIVRDEDLDDGDERLFEGEKSSVLSDESLGGDGSSDEDAAEETKPAAATTGDQPSAADAKSAKEDKTTSEPAKGATGDAAPVQEAVKPKSKPKKRKPKKVAKKPADATAENAKIEDKPVVAGEPQATEPKQKAEASTDSPKPPPPRRQQSDKPKFNAGYINPARINTGGLKNEKLSEAELASVMERMRLNNEQLKARRELVEADKEVYESTVQAETERQKADRIARAARSKADREARAGRSSELRTNNRQNQSQQSSSSQQQRPRAPERSEGDRKIQEDIDSQRAEAAKRKLAKQDVREWDAEKGPDWAKSNSRGESGRGRGGPNGQRGGRGDDGDGQGRPGPAPSLSSLIDAALSKAT